MGDAAAGPAEAGLDIDGIADPGGDRLGVGGRCRDATRRDADAQSLRQCDGLMLEHQGAMLGRIAERTSEQTLG